MAGVEADYVLTIFESLDFSEISYFSQLMSNLHRTGLPVAAPLSTLDGMTTTILRGKPAILMPRLPGKSIASPDHNQCRLIGAALSNLHSASLPVHLSRGNQFDVAWFKSSRDGLSSFLSGNDFQLLCRFINEITDFSANHGQRIPGGIIHGDLRKDNALFLGNELSGIIDFYHSCDDFFVLDLCITINDWCHDDQQCFDPGLYHALLDGYRSQRALSEVELLSLPTFLRVAAARYWICSSLLVQRGEAQSDPAEYRNILLAWYGENLNLLA